MKLRTGQTFPGVIGTPVQTPERIPFNTVTPEPAEPEVSDVTESATPPLVKIEKATEEIPRLVKTKGEDIPALQPVNRKMKRIDLSPPQPVAETVATAEPAKEVAGGDRPAAAWPFRPKEVKNGGDNTAAELRTNVDTSDSVDVLNDNSDNVMGDSSNVDDNALDNSGTGDDANHAETETDGVEADRDVPRLEPVRREEAVIPKLQTIREGNVKPENVTEIPKLEAYNTMEVVHLLIGKSVEDEDIVLLASYAERFVRGKSPEELTSMVQQRIGAHVNMLTSSGSYDFPDRTHNRSLVIGKLTPQHQARGVEIAFMLVDNGAPNSQDIRRFGEDNDLNREAAAAKMKLEGYYRDPESVYTWALVKVKIGHDFGSYKLSELMPNL
jgi:hypothetical protein